MSDTRENSEIKMDQSDGRRDQDERGGAPRKGKGFFKKKVCKFCTQKARIDYKDSDTLKRYTTERGKILPKRMSGNCARHQRELTIAVKRARHIALLPFSGE